MKLSLHAMHQPIIGLGDDIIPACNAAKTFSIKQPAEESHKDEEGEGRNFSGSLA